MPRYFFDTSDGGREVDADGVELADIIEAREMAARYASELLASEPTHLWDKEGWSVDVADGDRIHLFTLQMRCVEGSGRPLPD